MSQVGRRRENGMGNRPVARHLRANRRFPRRECRAQARRLRKAPGGGPRDRAAADHPVKSYSCWNRRLDGLLTLLSTQEKTVMIEVLTSNTRGRLLSTDILDSMYRLRSE